MLVIEGSCRMKSPRILNQLEAYWEALRPDGGLPSRDDINPRGIEDALNYSFMLSRSHSGDSVFRVAGEKLGELFGVSLERVPFSVLFSHECQPQVANSLNKVFSSPGILRAELVSEHTLMRPELTAHLIVMPLQPKDDDISLALGALYFDGIVGKAPRKFTNIVQHLTRIIVDENTSVSHTRNAAYGMADRANLFEHKEGLPTLAGRPKLKIINGGVD